MALVAILLKGEGSHINDFSFYLKELEKEEQIKLKVSRRKEIIKIRNQWNWKKKKTQKINKPQGWYFEKISKIDTLARLIRREKRHKLLVSGMKEQISLQILKS